MLNMSERRIYLHSVDVNCGSLVYQILKESPCDYVTEALAHDPRGESSEVSYEAIVLVDL
jgi:hypothetical protein